MWQPADVGGEYCATGGEDDVHVFLFSVVLWTPIDSDDTDSLTQFGLSNVKKDCNSFSDTAWGHGPVISREWLLSGASLLFHF